MKRFLKHYFNFFICSFFSFITLGQRNELHFTGGMSNYQGDLQPSRFSTVGISKAFAVTFKKEVKSNLYVRSGIGLNDIGADDAQSPNRGLRLRNLNFRSSVTDFHAALEYRLISPEKSRITPYAFAGLGVFHFNPYTYYGDKNEKIYLQPLGTEGQGLAEYPDRKMYALTQVSIPMGGGILFQINDRWMLGFEFKTNKTFTDYLDDVSTTYALQGPLLAARGQLAVDLAWRRDEIDGRPYPNSESKRGRSGVGNSDWYYMLGINIGFILPGKGSQSPAIRQLGCPKW